jgi:hypothetical protein
VRLTDDTDWEEIRELVTESYRRLARRSSPHGSTSSAVDGQAVSQITRPWRSGSPLAAHPRGAVDQRGEQNRTPKCPASDGLLIVLTLFGEQITDITRFLDNSILPRFGLPRNLPG